MICWQDFVIDDFLGASLVDTGLVSEKERNVMEDVETQGCVSIQETRMAQRPARMVGLANLDSEGMEADRESQTSIQRSR